MANQSVTKALKVMDDVVYKLRDINSNMVSAWAEAFTKYRGRVEVSKGDIFKHAPAADAIVSPANSFGFMDGGIDMAFSLHFGWQLQKRLQKIIKEEHDGELLVGNAIILPIYEGDLPAEAKNWKGCNQDEPIRFLISAPTMRVPLDVSNTANAYQAFRAIILAVQKHNANKDNEPIRSVLCPGLGTAVGKMPAKQCANQMREAFEIFDLNMNFSVRDPDHLSNVWRHHEDMAQFGSRDDGPSSPRGQARKSNSKGKCKEPELLTPSMLEGLDTQQQKQMICDRLYPVLQKTFPDLDGVTRGRITGMLLQQDVTELLLQLVEPTDELKTKVQECLEILKK